jgi:hypothetical protein
LTNSSLQDRDDSDSEILELEAIPAKPSQPIDIPPSSDLQITTDVPVPVTDNHNPDIKVSKIVTSIEIGTPDDIFNVTAELDALIETLERAHPQPPQLDRSLDIASLHQERDRQQQEAQSISETLAAIAASESAPDSQRQQELTNIHQQIATLQQELQALYQRNQSQVKTIAAHTDRIDRLKIRTHQLAHYTKDRVGKVQSSIAIVDAIRTEIITGLEKFGGYREIRSLLIELETSRQALVLAHDRLCTERETVYESLQAIEQRVTSHSNDAVERLRSDRALIESLSQKLSTDRLQMAEMSVELSLKYAQIQELSAQISDMHAQITEKSQLIHRRVADTERGFSELAESVRAEKDQFYELTAETIDRTADIRAQFGNIATEFSLDREAIAALKSELATVREGVERERERQLDYFDLHFYELLADWSELSDERQKRGSDRDKILIWMWILSGAIGLALAFSIYILMHLK